MDKLLTTSAAGEILGGEHPKDVVLLIRTGKLKAKRETVRGRASCRVT